MSKMTVIQLLNKIANGEEVPKKVRFAGIIFEYDEDDQMYGNEYKNICDYAFLNDTVEIIEEEKKIPEKLSTWFSVETKQSKELNIEYANTNFENMYKKINSIIDYLKSKGE